jgi:hypothetical protein
VLAAPAASAVRRNPISMSAVGPLRLGMTQGAEKKALRKLRPGSLRWVHDRHIKGGLTYREYSYYRSNGVDSYAVGFLGPRGKPRLLRVARITTYVPADRTARGAHLGTSLDALNRMYGSAMHCGTMISQRSWEYKPCRVGPSTKRHIVLLIGFDLGVSHEWTVNRIFVEEPGLRVSYLFQ